MNSQIKEQSHIMVNNAYVIDNQQLIIDNNKFEITISFESGIVVKLYFKKESIFIQNDIKHFMNLDIKKVISMLDLNREIILINNNNKLIVNLDGYFIPMQFSANGKNYLYLLNDIFIFEDNGFFYIKSKKNTTRITESKLTGVDILNIIKSHRKIERVLKACI